VKSEPAGPPAGHALFDLFRGCAVRRHPTQRLGICERSEQDMLQSRCTYLRTCLVCLRTRRGKPGPEQKSETPMGVIAVLVAVIVLYILFGLRIVQQYERGVVFRLGRAQSRVREPGLQLILLGIDRLRTVSLRTMTMPIQSQQIITKDNVSIDVAAVAYFHVNDPMKSIIAIQDVNAAINQIAQTTVRNIIGQSMLDDVLSETEQINAGVKVMLDQATEAWGAQVTLVELKDIRLPETMQRAMAKQAEAEREKRAKVIAAEGEQLSAQKLGEAADIIAAHPVALQLRNLQVLGEIAAEKNSTIVFPSAFLDSWASIANFVSSELRAGK
jgi:regulator of protease activity HflC (stomatin/prohibitin superfamily)